MWPSSQRHQIMKARRPPIRNLIEFSNNGTCEDSRSTRNSDIGSDIKTRDQTDKRFDEVFNDNGQKKVNEASASEIEENEALQIYLDLDETLVQTFFGSVPEHIQAKAKEAGLKSHQLRMKYPTGMVLTTIYERPGLQRFLYRASKLGQVVIFTAGIHDYARVALKKINKHGFIQGFFSRSRCTQIMPRLLVKDLSKLECDLDRAALVDNNPKCFLPQPRNGIPCSDFHAENGMDQELNETIIPILKHCATRNDVRDYLGPKFGLRKKLLENGYEPSFIGL